MTVIFEPTEFALPFSLAIGGEQFVWAFSIGPFHLVYLKEQG